MYEPRVIHFPEFDCEVIYDGCNCGKYYHSENWGQVIYITNDKDICETKRSLSLFDGIFGIINDHYNLKLEKVYVIASEIATIIRNNLCLLTFTIPEKIRLHSVDYLILRPEKMTGNAIGEHDVNMQNILILKALNNDRAYLTLWHEILHHIRAYLDCENTNADMEELIIHILSLQVVGLLKHNDFRFLLGECNTNDAT